MQRKLRTFQNPMKNTAIALITLLSISVLGLSSCDTVFGPPKSVRENAQTWTAKEFDEFLKSHGAIPKAVHEKEKWDFYDRGYKQGCIDQVVSQAQSEPIYVARFEGNDLVVYKPLVPVIVYRNNPSSQTSKAADIVSNPPAEMPTSTPKPKR